MKKTAIYRLVLSGLMVAVITAVTYFPVPVPIAHGYVNLGDAFVILAGVVLGPAYGFMAAGVGSALADVLVGFANYAPATFIIKGLMALVVCYVAGSRNSAHRLFRTTMATVLSEVIMVTGYLAFELMLYGVGAIASVPGNCIQGVCCAVLGSLLTIFVTKNSFLCKTLSIR